MKKTIIILVLAFLCQFSCTPVLISKKKAIEIAMKNGMKQGIEAPVAILVDGKFWEVKCLMCDDGGESESFIVKINATTGKIERPSINEISISSYAGEQPGKTRMDLWTDIDNIPVRSSANKPYRLTNLKEGSEFNAVISPDDQVVAYQYGINKIGVNNLNGQGFIKICDECQNPQWIDNDWIAYLKYSNRIYKKNIKTQEEIPVTLNVIKDPDFQISPDYRWIAYTSMRGDGTNMISSINGNGQELCLQSVDGKKMQFVTKTGSYVNTPVWKGDSLFFLY